MIDVDWGTVNDGVSFPEVANRLTDSERPKSPSAWSEDLDIWLGRFARSYVGRRTNELGPNVKASQAFDDAAP